MIPPEQAQLKQVQKLRQEIIKRRFWQMVGIAAGLSLVIHFGIMVYLEMVERAGPPAQSLEMVMEFPSTRTVEELTTLAHTNLAEPDAESRSELDQILEPDTPAPEESSAAELSESDVGATPTLGGSGQKGVSGSDSMGGAGGAASFFGVTSKGERIAYIVDYSGSMTGHKLNMAKAEVFQSVRKLPDYAKFFVVFFASENLLKAWKTKWARAVPNQFKALGNWLEKGEPSNGGTEPLSAFKRVFSLRPKPDVIFFLTDGQIFGMESSDISELNQAGRPAVINTIAFATEESQQLLEEIARESGGAYRFVPVRPRR